MHILQTHFVHTRIHWFAPNQFHIVPAEYQRSGNHIHYLYFLIQSSPRFQLKKFHWAGWFNRAEWFFKSCLFFFVFFLFIPEKVFFFFFHFLFFLCSVSFSLK